MRIGMIGLGRMGANMTTRLIRAGHEVVAHDLRDEALKMAKAEGATPAETLEELVAALPPPRIVWLMVPAGEATQRTIQALAELLGTGDTVIDGGNSRYTDSIARAAMLAERGVDFLDAGTSGGIWGLREGFCLMIGGPAGAYERAEPLFAALAPEHGYARVGPTGAGHFTKMVHNGIEYGLMQAYGEGFALLDASPLNLDLAQVAELWRHGSVIRSWLLDLAARALAHDPELRTVRGYVEDSGEGRWTVESAIELAVPAPAIAAALFARFASRTEDGISDRLIAALRREFGGHAVQEADE